MKVRIRMVAPLVLAGLAAASQLLAQSGTVRPATPTKKAMFWQVTSGDKIGYLLGSIHVGSTGMYPLPKEIEDAFERSAVLLVEIDINHVDLAKMQGLVLQTGMYAADDTLWNHVSQETRQRLEEFCEKYSIPSVAVAKMKPWAVAMMVATVPLMKNGLDPGLGIDKYFLDKADQVRKRVVEIETVDGQMKLISSITADMLEKAVASQAKQNPQEYGKQIQGAWTSGDTTQMEKITQEMMSSDPADFSAAMLKDRNLHMADVAEQFLKSKEIAFVVVGAGHMVGADGVVKLLEKRGYKVEQVALAGLPH